MKDNKNKFIDNHSHIIPNVDDGSRSIDESIRIARQAFEQGIETIFATPHLIIDKYTEKCCQNIERNFIELKKAIADENIGISLLLGYELYANRNLIYKPNLSKYCIEGTDYILVEVNPNNELTWLTDFVYELNLQGIKIILAHPERYIYLLKEPNLLKILDDYGVLFQINTTSILGDSGRKIHTMVKNLVKKGYAHLIGTDTHYDGHVGLDIIKAYNILLRWIDEDKAQEIAYKNAVKLIYKKGI